MLFKFRKYSQLIYSLLLFLIFLLGDKTVADPNPSVEEIILCKKISEKLESNIGSFYMRLLHPHQPIVADEKKFAHFMVQKIEKLRKNLKKFLRKFHELKKSEQNAVEILDYAVKKLDNAIEKAKINENNDCQILDRILDNNPGHFFAVLDLFSWKIEDSNLSVYKKENGLTLIKYTENIFPPIVEYEGGANYSTGNKEVIVVKEYIDLRKIINEYIKELKTEIVYGQGVKAISEINGIHSKLKETFKKEIEKMNKKAENFVKTNKEKFKELKKGIQMARRIKLADTIEKENPNIHQKYNELYLYNLLNNIIIELCKNLEVAVAKAVNGNFNGKEIEIGLQAELLVPFLFQAYENVIVNMYKSHKGMEFLAKLKKQKEASSSSNSKNCNVFQNNLVKFIKKNLGLPKEFLQIEQFMIMNSMDGPAEMNECKSHVRIAAAKLLLVYERLKKIYNVQKLTKDEKEELEKMEHHLAQPMLKSFGELLDKYLMNH